VSEFEFVLEDDGYGLDDPKSPGYADRMWAYADMLRKREREDAVLGCCPHGIDLDRAFCPHGCRV